MGEMSFKIMTVLLLSILSFIILIQYTAPRKSINDYMIPRKITFITNNPIEYKIKTIFEKQLPRDLVQSEFLKTLLVIIYNHPHYESIPLLKGVYHDIFAKVIACGNPSNSHIKPDIEAKIELRGLFGYQCVSKAMEIYKDVEGYMVVADDMVVNWWRFHSFPKDKIWYERAGYEVKIYKPLRSGWSWWPLDIGFPACRRFYEIFKNASNIPILQETYLSTCGGEPCCGCGRSDVFYVPKNFSQNFILLSNMAFQQRLFLEIAAPLILGSLDELKNHVQLKGYFITSHEGRLSKKDLYFWEFYDTKFDYIHSMKFSKDKSFGGDNYALFKRYYLQYSNEILGKNS